MQASVFPGDAEIGRVENRVGTRHPTRLTPSQLQQLGMFRVAYLVGERSSAGLTITIHSADGMTVAVVDTLAQAVELAGQLGLALVAVH